MSSEWDDLTRAVEGRVRPDLHAEDFAAWKRELRLDDAEPWWLACGISKTGAVVACLLPFLAFVFAVLASGAGH